jgi:hypothetical protein
MADTLGSLIDKMITADLKLWNNQEFLYEIRKMSFDEYKNKFFESDDGAKILWDWLMKLCDLNLQRNQYIDEIDEMFISIVKDAMKGKELDKYLQKKHKTYNKGGK